MPPSDHGPSNSFVHKELILGLADDLSLEEINTRLPQRGLKAPSCVSHGWHHAIWMCQQLILRHSNNITLEHISTKIPWRLVLALSHVSCGRHHAIQISKISMAIVWARSTRQELVHTDPHSTLEFATIYYKWGHNNFFVSIPWEIICLKLPPLWVLSKLVAVDGRMYPMRRLVKENSKQYHVYMLDLTRQRKWKQCYRMNERTSCVLHIGHPLCTRA